MSVNTKFENFCENIRISDSDVNHSLYIGSCGRIFTSDIDMRVQLPYEVYQKYNNYTGNRQSALLQDVKNIIAKAYSTTHLKRMEDTR